jgi:hypothetical protein
MAMLSRETVLAAEACSKSYGRRVVHDGVSLTPRRGEMVGSSGPISERSDAVCPVGYYTLPGPGIAQLLTQGDSSSYPSRLILQI